MWDWRTYFIFGFFLVWAVIFLKEYSRKPKKWSFLVLAFLPLFFLHAFRAETVGTDLPNYALHVEDGGWFLNNYGQPPLEILSQFLFYLSHELGGFHTFLFLSSLLEYAFLFIAMREVNKCKVDPGMTFVIMFSYVVLRSVSMVRNGIALSVALCAVAQFFDNEKSSKWKYWIYTAIALGFHNSAILLIPIYVICRPIDKEDMHFKLRITVRVLIMIVLFGLLYSIGQSGILDLFYLVAGDAYSESHFEENASWGIGNIIVRLPLLVLFIWAIPQIKKAGIDYLPLLMLFLFDILISQTKYIAQDFERLTMYTGLSKVLVWGILYSAFGRIKGAVVKYIFVLVGVYYFTDYIYTHAILASDGAGNGLMPYHTWFSFL